MRRAVWVLTQTRNLILLILSRLFFEKYWWQPAGKQSRMRVCFVFSETGNMYLSIVVNGFGLAHSVIPLLKVKDRKQQDIHHSPPPTTSPLSKSIFIWLLFWICSVVTPSAAAANISYSSLMIFYLYVSSPLPLSFQSSMLWCIFYSSPASRHTSQGLPR